MFEIEFAEDAVLDGLCFGEFMGLEGMDDIVSHHLAVAECGLDFVFEVGHLNGFLVIGMLESLNKLVQVIDVQSNLGKFLIEETGLLMMVFSLRFSIDDSVDKIIVDFVSE